MKKPSLVEQDLLKVIKYAAEAQKRHQQLIAALRAKLRACTHAEATKYYWEHDDGYGRQTLHVGLKCVACGSIQHYENSSWVSGDAPKRHRE